MIEGVRQIKGEKSETESEKDTETENADVSGRGRSPGGGPWASTGKRVERILPADDVSGVGGELRGDGKPDRRGVLCRGQLPGELGSEADIESGGPMSRASVRVDDRADGCGVPGSGAAGGAGAARGALYRSNPQEQGAGSDGEAVSDATGGTVLERASESLVSRADVSGGELGPGAPGGAGGAGATGGVVSGSLLVVDEPESEAV